MAKKARKARRNPIKTTGALVVNPRRRKTVKRKNSSLGGLKFRPFKGATGRHKVKKVVKAHVRRVKNPVPAFLRRFAVRRPVRAVRPRVAARRHFLRSHPRLAARFRRNSLALVQNRKRKGKKHVRRNSLALVQNRKHRKSRKHSRRNPGMVAGTVGTVQKYASKLPLVGGFLASAIGFAIPAALGAIGIVPTMQLARIVGPMVPSMDASLFYGGIGLVGAALVKTLLPKTGLVSADMANKLAIAIAAGAGAVAVYKKVKGESSDMSGELGELEVSMGDLGDGFATAVAPMGTFGDFGDFGELEIVSGMYNDATVADVAHSPDDLDYGEIEIALSGPKKWRKKFGKKSGQPAGQKGHRHGWIIKWIGFDNFQKLAALPAEQRRAYIAQLKQSAMAQASQMLGGSVQGVSSSGDTDMSGWGAPLGAAAFAY